MVFKACAIPWKHFGWLVNCDEMCTQMYIRIRWYDVSQVYVPTVQKYTTRLIMRRMIRILLVRFLFFGISLWRSKFTCGKADQQFDGLWDGEPTWQIGMFQGRGNYPVLRTPKSRVEGFTICHYQNPNARELWTATRLLSQSSWCYTWPGVCPAHCSSEDGARGPGVLAVVLMASVLAFSLMLSFEFCSFETDHLVQWDCCGCSHRCRRSLSIASFPFPLLFFGEYC